MESGFNESRPVFSAPSAATHWF